MAIDNGKPLVSIFCLTYNHAPYIRQCLDGFLMQKTTFVYEVIINDDASTDGTTEIIREYEEKYPDIIKPIYHEENLYSKGERGFWNRYCLPRSKGKYVALCEGDDYWIDPYKLQKQVDLLENNVDYGLIHTLANVYDVSKKQVLKKKIGGSGNSFKELLYSSNIATLTTCFRREFLSSYIKEVCPFSRNWGMGDYPLWLWISLQSEIAFLPEVTATYTLLPESASHSKDCDKVVLFRFSSYKIALFYANCYLEKEDRKQFINIKFCQLLLSIVKHRDLKMILLLLDEFSKYRKILYFGNKILFALLRVCGTVF